MNDSILNEIMVQLQTLRNENQELRAQLANLRNIPPPQPPVIAPTPGPDSDPKYPDVPVYNGKSLREAKQFILKLDTFFQGQLRRYNTVEKQVSYIVGRLTDIAWDWIEPFVEEKFDFVSYENFKTLFFYRFSDPSSRSRAERSLKGLKQGNRAVSVMASELRTLAMRTSWNEEALMSTFYDALNEEVKDEIIKSERPSSLEEYIKLAVKIDNRLFERRQERKTTGGKNSTTQHSNKNNFHRNNYQNSTPSGITMSTGSSANTHSVESMQIDATRKTLTDAERQRRRENGLCAYCGGNHKIDSCNLLKNKKTVNATVQASDNRISASSGARLAGSNSGNVRARS